MKIKEEMVRKRCCKHKRKSFIGWTTPDWYEYFSWRRHKFGEPEIDASPIVRYKHERDLIKVRITIEEIK